MRYGALLTLLLVLPACTPVLRLQEDIADFEDEIARLQRRMIDAPGDAEVLRELGVIYMRTGNYVEGSTYLQQAYGLDTDDPKTLFYLGLANEMLGRRDTALRLYEQDVSRLSRYRSLMRGRAAQIRRGKAQEEVLRLMRQEEQQAAPPTSPRIVAVFPFSYQGGDDRYAPLGRGLSEMVMTDLATVSTLTLVERVRLQALLDELELAESAFVDPSTAPRSGRLLGAGRVIGGTFSVADGDLAMNAAIVTTEDAASRSLEPTSGDLDNLFDLEKQLVFSLVGEMGIELTPEEQERIQRVPTRNLQAFLAYSQGLQAEDAGNYGAAAQAFQQAASLDPGFSAAADRAETASGMEVTAGDPETVLAAAVELEAPPGRTVDPVDLRLRVLNTTLSGMFLPGEDTRKAAQEGAAPLGSPPPPPGGQ